MIYLIFTIEGFTEAKQDLIEDKAELWINKDILSDEQLVELGTQDITINILPELVDANNEKAIIVALDYVEKISPEKEILVEYP